MRISEQIPGSPSSLTVTVLLTLFLVVACGNKGPLYIEADQEALEELEGVQKDIDNSAKKKRKQAISEVAARAILSPKFQLTGKLTG